jgi:hypothetical protein
MRGPLADLVEQEFGGGAPDEFAGLADRRQRDARRGGVVDVVVADDCDVAGHPEPVADHSLEDAQRHQVVGAEHGGRPLGFWHLEDLLARPPAGLDGQGGGFEDLEVRGLLPAIGQRLDGTQVPVLDLAECKRPAGEGDAPVATLKQVARGEEPPEHVIDGHRAEVGQLGPAVHEDDGGASLHEDVEPRVVGADRGDEHALHALLLEDVEVAGLPLHGLTAVAQHDDGAVFGRRCLDAVGDVGEEGVGDVEHDQSDGAAAAGPELACRLVAHEPQIVDGVQNPATGVGSHEVGPVEDVAHGPDGHAGMAGDVFYSRAGQVSLPPLGRPALQSLRGAAPPPWTPGSTHSRQRADGRKPTTLLKRTNNVRKRIMGSILRHLETFLTSAGHRPTIHTNDFFASSPAPRV